MESGASPSKRFKAIHYRSGSSGSIPYIKLFDGLSERLPITRVIVGPSRNQLSVLEQVRDLVQKHGLDPEVVQLSEIPYVGSA